MYHLELINEVYPRINRPSYKSICIDIGKILLPTCMFISVSGWIGYIIGTHQCNSDMSHSI